MSETEGEKSKVGVQKTKIQEERETDSSTVVPGQI